MATSLPLQPAGPRTPAQRDAIKSQIATMGKSDWSAVIASGEFEVKLQPVVKLDDLHLTGFEGLTRWHHASYGELDPSMFLGPLIRSGRAAELTAYVLEKTAQFQVHAQYLGLDLVPISVNATGTEFQDGTFLTEALERLLARHHLPKGSISLEMTETEWIQNPPAAAFNIVNLRKIGVVTYADDFGHAYASLRNLLDFDFAGLKMDRSFVLALTDDERAKIVIRNTASLANELGLSFVAEGIESELQLQTLRELGVTHGQGYLFDRPLAMEHAYKRLKAKPLAELTTQG